MLHAVLFQSEERFTAFKNKLLEFNVDVTVMDFRDHEWIDFDYTHIDFIIYYPTFKFSSNHPLALSEVHDNLIFLWTHYPHLKIFPDPKGIRYYNDKYRQYLFLTNNGFPTPKTIPLLDQKSVGLAERELGFPMIVKNRYGAGGDSVFRVHNRRELQAFYNLSKLNLFNVDSAKYFFKMFTQRIFYYHLIKAKKMNYPFLSFPILAQKFVNIDRDLKTVVGDKEVVEAHWRFPADEKMWKMNIDGGGTGVWAFVPDEALNLSIALTKKIDASWMNLDLILSDNKFLVTEFSPVWHHYAYKEKPSFVYKDDYNIDTPIKIALDLEQIIVESLTRACMK